MHRVRVSLSAIVTAGLLAAPMGAPAEATHLQLSNANFQARCVCSHAAGDDPIVFPGQPGAAHLHDFFGSTVTDAFSSTQDFRAGATTCDDLKHKEPEDKSSYWSPTILYHGNAVRPTTIDAYYYLQGKYPGNVQPPPMGLRMIAGSSKATAAQSIDIVHWQCFTNGTDATKKFVPIPVCNQTTTSYVTVLLEFPDCWDGMNLDSADHKSHMAYSGGSPSGGPSCPSTHPVELPGLRIRYRWKGFQNADGTATLSSGGVYSFHGDFWNAWGESRIKFLVDSCLNVPKDCNP